MLGCEVGIAAVAGLIDRQARQTGRTEAMLKQAEWWAARNAYQPVNIVLHELGFQHDIQRRINLHYPALREAGVNYISVERLIRPSLGTRPTCGALYWDHAAIEKALRLIAQRADDSPELRSLRKSNNDMRELIYKMQKLTKEVYP